MDFCYLFGFRVQDSGFRVWGLGLVGGVFGVWGLGCIGFKVYIEFVKGLGASKF